VPVKDEEQAIAMANVHRLRACRRRLHARSRTW
jgi:hypothetical protein